MSQESRKDVAELFGEGEGAPSPRTFTILSLLGGGLLVGLLGLACTSVPGGVMVLFAWMLAEKEMDRVESGYLPAESRGIVRMLQVSTFAGVVGVVFLFLFQGWLFCSGVYDGLWMEMLSWIAGDPVAPPPPPDPDVLTLPGGAPPPTPAPAPPPPPSP